MSAECGTARLTAVCRNGHRIADVGVRADGRCAECARLRSRRHYWAHRESVLAKQRRYYEHNRNAVRERHRRYYEQNREAIRERQRRWRERRTEGNGARHPELVGENRTASR